MPTLQRLLSVVVLAGAGFAAGAPPAATLIDAARKGDAQAVGSLLRQKTVDVNAAAVDGTTPLHWAVQREDAAMAQMLVRAGADVKAPNRYGVRPLWTAAASGNAALVKLLLEAGADANTSVAGDETAIMTAARAGNVETLKLLVAHGASLNAADARGQTALMWAAARNNAPAIRMLVEAGADIAVRTNNPIKSGRNAEIGVFTSPPPTGFTAFLFAVRAGNVDSARALLEAGASVNDVLSDGESALVVATANAHWEMADFLLDKGADPNLAGAGWNALHQTVHSRRPNLGYTPGPVPTGSVDSINVVKKLIARGIKLDARMTRNGMKDGQRNRVNRLGTTAFFLAAKNNDFEVMKVLADSGASAKIPSADGTTPLMVAAGLAMWYVGEDGGSLPGQEDEVLEAVKLCVALGNDVNAANNAGETPMHGAAFRGVNAVVDFLVAQGAKLDPRDIRGWTPLTVATGIAYGDVYKQQPQTAELLTKLMKERGLSTEGQVSDGTECLDCIQTHADQARAALERDKKMEAEFNKPTGDQAANGPATK
jgi:ankyrin repeat protein